MNILKKIALILVLVTIAVVSITKLAPWYTNVENHEKTIEQIDLEINKVMGLTAGAAGASAVISLLPDDSCTPIANELAEFSKCFLIVLSALYLEKYLITVFGYAAFSFIVPIACACLGFWAIAKKSSFKSVAIRLLAGALLVVLLVPTSAKVSELIQNTYENSIEETIQEAERITVAADENDENWFEKFSHWLSNAAVSVSEYVTGLLSKFVEALAVMLVTSCLIPILIVIIFVWLIKVLFGIRLPAEYPIPKFYRKECIEKNGKDINNEKSSN